jgi:hypothetical protein
LDKVNKINAFDHLCIGCSMEREVSPIGTDKYEEVEMVGMQAVASVHMKDILPSDF